MTDFLVYTKATITSSAAMFVILWCVVGLPEAIKLILGTLISLIVIAAILSATVTLLFMFYDWKNRSNAKSNSANRTRQPTA